MTQLQAGQSLAQIATTKGQTADDVVKAARAALSTQLQEAVTARSITQAQADAELARFDHDAPPIVNNKALGTKGGHSFGFGQGGPGGPVALISATASVTGLSAPEAMTQRQAGQSLAQIAQAKGKTGADVITAARTALSTQLQQAVTAGRITQAQAEAKLTQHDQSATQIVNDATLGQRTGQHGGPWGGPNGQNGTNGTNGTNNVPARPRPAQRELTRQIHNTRVSGDLRRVASGPR